MIYYSIIKGQKIFEAYNQIIKFNCWVEIYETK
jgi:hypothetical protein